MPGITEALTELHQLQLKLQQVEDELSRGPRQLKVRERRIADTEDEIQQLKARQKEYRASADRKQLDLRSREQKISDLQAKLNAASSNREYDTLRGQIEADTVANSVLEDEILEFLEKVDTTQRQVVETEAKVLELKAERDQFAVDFKEQAKQLEAQAAELRSKVKVGEQILAGDNALRYRRLVEAYGSDSLASVGKSGVCSNCFVSLTPNSMVHVQGGQVVFCSTCGRLLYASEG
ncbi:MAG: hypothetical protein R3B90_14015 [Planctomycetaceae bacterium]|jgi:predicted  nucleic acid-binding Zn-ribbon protein